MNVDFLLTIDDKTQKSLNEAAKAFPREIDIFLKREASKLRKLTLKLAEERITSRSGNFVKSIKRGKPYDFNNARAIRAYSYAPHAHLIEDGHRIYIRRKKGAPLTPTDKTTRAFKIFESSRVSFLSQYVEDAQRLVEKMTEKGL